MQSKTHAGHSTCDAEPTMINAQVHENLTKQLHLLHQGLANMVRDELWYLIASLLCS